MIEDFGADDMVERESIHAHQGSLEQSQIQKPGRNDNMQIKCNGQQRKHSIAYGKMKLFRQTKNTFDKFKIRLAVNPTDPQFEVTLRKCSIYEFSFRFFWQVQGKIDSR